jgi:hypothetical protein
MANISYKTPEAVYRLTASKIDPQRSTLFSLNFCLDNGEYLKPLLHQIAHVAITQLVSDISPHVLNDKKMIEVAAFEERGLLTR